MHMHKDAHGKYLPWRLKDALLYRVFRGVHLELVDSHVDEPEVYAMGPQ